MVRWRLYIAVLFILLLNFLVLGRLYNMQILKGGFYQAKAEDMQSFSETISSRRGEVFVNNSDNGNLVATNKKFYRVFAVPVNIESNVSKEGVASALSAKLELEKEEILKKLSKKNDPYEPITDNLTKEEANELVSIAPKVLSKEGYWCRFYPLEENLGHVLGFFGHSKEGREGIYGVEGHYNSILSGQKGVIKGLSDAFGNLIPFANFSINEAEKGSDIFLTIDLNIQSKAKQIIDRLVEKREAASGQIVVMNPDTGAIKAMAFTPSYDPNKYYEVEDKSVFLNPAFQDSYEPGSVFKPITVAAGIDSGAITPESSYVDKGEVNIGKYTIKNYDEEAHGRVNIKDVLRKSLNTGAIFAMRETGKETFFEYVKKLGFGKSTNVDLGGVEEAGSLAGLKTNRDINYATASFGQGISTNSLQLLRAYSALVNGGDLPQPHIVDRIEKDNGETVETRPSIKEDVIKDSTSRTMKKLLVNDIEEGYGQRAKIDGYFVGGKTGTAQIAKVEGKGYSKETIQSFIGVLPGYDPKFVTIVQLTRPQKSNFASDSVIPAFGELGNFLLDYKEIPPSRNE